jgi:hypothetical protein
MDYSHLDEKHWILADCRTGQIAPDDSSHGGQYTALKSAEETPPQGFLTPHDFDEHGDMFHLNRSGGGLL